MADPKNPRHFSDGFKRQIVELCNAGKPMSEIMAEYDLGRSTVRRWIVSINATGSPHAADNRTPDQARAIELDVVVPPSRQHIAPPLVGDSCIFVSHRRLFRKSTVLRRPLESTEWLLIIQPITASLGFLRAVRFAY